MKVADYAVLGVGKGDITFAPRTERARQRTPNAVVFTDRTNALEYMKSSEAEGYRFLNARNLDETRTLVRYGYFVKGRRDELVKCRQNWGPLDTDYEPGDQIFGSNILGVFTGTAAASRAVEVMIVLDALDERLFLPDAKNVRSLGAPKQHDGETANKVNDLSGSAFTGVRYMKAIEIVRKTASYLMSLGVITIILTIVQPKNSEVDNWFRIGAGVVILVCLAILFGLKAPSLKTHL